MNVLVACEESQRVCAAFRARGHNAFSCDIVSTSGTNPEWHIKADCIPLLNGCCSFTTEDNITHTIQGKWDMIIGFPPCTYFSAAGACRLFPKGELNVERYQKGLEMKKLFMAIYNADCEKIVLENPTPLKIWELPKHSQVVQPYFFGEPYKKRTLLWIKGLPQLKPTNLLNPDDCVSWVNGGNLRSNGNRRTKTGIHRNPKTRSKTFQGLADAMAEQWGGFENVK